MKIIIDLRMREIEKKFLKSFGEVIELKTQDVVYDEISSHPDIFFCKINDTLIKAKNVRIKEIESMGEIGKSNVEGKYPGDIKYNACNIGKYVIHNFEYTDRRIIEMIEKYNLVKVNVEQGYSNCSIAKVSLDSCITTDKGIYNALKKNNLDVLYAKESNIRLLDRAGRKTKMQGFIGGATALINNKFILFGDSKYLENRKEIIKFIEKYNLELVEFKNLEIYDYGGIVII